MLKRKNNKRGFTIIELTIVVSVIAILSAVLIPTFAGITKKARQTADETAVRNLNEIIALAEDDITDVKDLIEYLESKDVVAGSYVPMSKGYSFVWATEFDKVLLLSEKNGVVFPKEYVGYTNYLTIVDYKGKSSDKIDTADAAVEVSNKGGVVAIDSEITLESALYVTKDLTVNLTGTISNPNDTNSDGVFSAKKGTLTLNGNGTVNGKTTADWNMAVWADGGEIVINGGNYTNVGAKATDENGNPNNNELIYVSNGGKIIINGGTFKCENTVYTLNVKDTTKGTIILQGGSFFNYNPATDVTTPDIGKIIIADGYEVKAEPVEGTNDVWYTVVKKAA